MTKIPKKLSGIDYGEINIANIVITLNEIIGYLEANQTKEKSYKAASSVCCDSSFRLEGDTKEGTMYHVCNNCNKSCGTKLTEKKVETSKGGCACKSYETVEIGCEVCHPELKLDSPEHEESPHGYKLRHEDCEDCIKVTGDAWKPNMSEYVSKEKIKNSGVSIIRGFYLKGRNDEINKIVPDLEKLTGEIEHQLKKVGLGD